MPLRNVWVGPVQCTFVKTADREPLAQSVRAWTLPGVDGVAWQVLGRNRSHYSCEAILLNTTAAVKVWEAALGALQGQRVAIFDDWQDTHVVLIEQVTIGRRKAEIGNGGCIGTARIEGRYTQ